MADHDKQEARKPVGEKSEAPDPQVLHALDDALRGLNAERLRVDRCRLGLTLATAGLLLQILFAFAAEAALGSGDPEGPPRPSRIVYVVQAVFTVGMLLPASVLCLRAGGTARWRQAAWVLVGCFAVDFVLLVIAAIWASSSTAAAEPPPWYLLLLAEAPTFLGWIELWNLAVLVGEFTSACKERRLAEQTVWLGYTILVGAALHLASLAWLLPRVESLAQDPDEVFVVLLLSRQIAMLVALIWTINILANSALLAHHLLLRARTNAQTAAAGTAKRDADSQPPTGGTTTSKPAEPPRSESQHKHSAAD